MGVEHLTLEFPASPYRGFGREAGYNALYFWSTAHCWVRDVAVVNADAGLVLDGTQFCTVADVELASGPRGVDNGAWGVWLKNGADNLITGLSVSTRFVRDVAVQGVQPGTVLANSSGVDLSVDLLYGGPRTAGGNSAARVMLHARKLVFPHPITRAEMTIEAPIPADMLLFAVGDAAG